MDQGRDTWGAGAEASEGVVVLTPKARIVGPGRRERDYQRRVSELEGEVDRRSTALATLRREKAISELVERGTGRWADRIEGELEATRHQASRLLVALGALQRENEGLRQELGAAKARLTRISAPMPAAPGPVGVWRRLFGR